MRDAVREVQASCFSREQDVQIGSITASYSVARMRLSEDIVESVHQRIYRKMQPVKELLGGRNILVVDASGIQLEDTLANQEQYPQLSEQKLGCGFPVMRLVGLFNLNTAALEKFSFSPLTADESAMFDVELPIT